MAKPKSQGLTLDEYYAIGLVTTLVIILISLYFRKKPEKYKQTNPYVAQVDLHERYGGLEKRQVSIDDLSNEQLALLERDGKLNDATIAKLRREGRLVDPNAPVKVKKEVPVMVPTPTSPGRTTPVGKNPTAGKTGKTVEKEVGTDSPPKKNSAKKRKPKKK